MRCIVGLMVLAAMALAGCQAGTTGRMAQVAYPTPVMDYSTTNVVPFLGAPTTLCPSDAVC